jgi:hypothetical protein
MKKKLFFVLMLSFISLMGFAQVGGRNTFEFVRMPTDAFGGSLGGVNVSTGSHDVNAFWRNPALLEDTVYRHAALSYIPWHADIHNFTLAYVQPFKKLNALAFGLNIVNYGTLQETDPSGQVLGEFKAQDFNFNVGYSIQQDNFRFGANAKLLGSQIDVYSAYALAMDLGVVFKHPVQNFTFGLAIKNIGFGMSKYTPDTRLNMPFDVQMGTTFKPEFMPLRFSLSLHHLYQFDITYLDPNRQTQLDANGTPVAEEKKFFDKVARHFVFGGEILLSSNFQINIGYNHLINREMKITNQGGLRGVSFGFQLRTKKFALTFGRGTYHIGEGRSFFTLRSDLGQIIKRK